MNEENKSPQIVAPQENAAAPPQNSQPAQPVHPEPQINKPVSNTPNNKIKEMFEKATEKITLPIPPVIKKVMVVLAILIAVLFILSIIASIIRPLLQRKAPTSTPTPAATPQPVEIIEEPSPYAKDEEVLSIESQISDLEKKLQETDFREDILRPPSFDWSVDFGN